MSFNICNGGHYFRSVSKREGLRVCKKAGMRASADGNTGSLVFIKCSIAYTQTERMGAWEFGANPYGCLQGLQGLSLTMTSLHFIDVLPYIPVIFFHK